MLQMKPEQASKRLHNMLRAIARMNEFNTSNDHLDMQGKTPDELFPLVIGILGDETASFSTDTISPTGMSRLPPVDASNLRFAATFFNAYLNTHQNEELREDVLLLGAATYYLADFAGSASVLVSEIIQDKSSGDEWLILLRWLLVGNWNEYPTFNSHWYSEHLNSISKSIAFYFYNGTLKLNLKESCNILKNLVYENGNSKELLLVDIICAIIIKRLHNSSRETLPIYSELSSEQWEETFNKPAFMKELWPSQHLLGKRGVFLGKSAIIQMPTSAGKTRAIELVIRSAFISNRANLAIIIAPFRALCNEITNSLRLAFNLEKINVNNISDVLQKDYSETFSDLLNLKKQIVVITPEKLLYTLRHFSKLVDVIGLVVYDEGHQFDNGMRGVTYELLLASIKNLLPTQAQTLLISAVIQNAKMIGEWLIGEQVEIIGGENLSTTERSFAFASWMSSVGQLQYIEPYNLDNFSYFVPRIIEQQELQKKKLSEKPRYFPDKKDSKSIAMYLGLKIVKNGSVAIFCGKKTTASTMTSDLIEGYKRGLTLAAPSNFSDKKEVNSLISLYTQHYGRDAIPTKCAELGVFCHHGNTPHGIRLAVEHAMKEGLIKFVVCTSTLAQGVNLPVRYLIISSIYQDSKPIRTRDFHNLLGRAGRAGMYIEGTILFSDPLIFDQKTMYKKEWRWKVAINLLNPANTEPTTSSLLNVLTPFHNGNKNSILPIDVINILSFSLESPHKALDSLTTEAKVHRENDLSIKSLTDQLQEKIFIIEAIQSYLMSHRDNDSITNFITKTVQLAKDTLAYHLADSKQKEDVIRLFLCIAQRIEESEPNPHFQAIYGRTLLGLHCAASVRKWSIKNQNALSSSNSTDELLKIIWPLLIELLSCQIFERYFPNSALLDLIFNWISGNSFIQLFHEWNTAGGKKKYGTSTRNLKLDEIVNLCENVFGHEITLIISAIAEFVEELEIKNSDRLILELNFLQKRIKYGLPDKLSILFFEEGFSDRMIAIEMRDLTKEGHMNSIKHLLNNDKIYSLVQKYPKYYRDIYAQLIA